MKYIILIAAVIFLTGCQSLTMAGSSAYTLTQTTDKNGNPNFELSVKSGKEIAQVEAHLTKDGDKITVDLKETGVAAFQGQAISSGAVKTAAELAAKAAVAAVMAGAAPGIISLAGSALSDGGLPAAAVGAGGALAVQRVLAKPDPETAAP